MPPRPLFRCTAVSLFIPYPLRFSVLADFATILPASSLASGTVLLAIHGDPAHELGQLRSTGDEPQQIVERRDRYDGDPEFITQLLHCGTLALPTLQPI